MDFNSHVLTVERQLLRTRYSDLYINEPKTMSGARKIPMTPDVEKCLRQIIAERPTVRPEPVVKSPDGKISASGFLFFDKDRELTVAQHWENYYRYATAAYRHKVPDATDKTISSHVARHTFCGLRVREGMQPKTLQKIMGHSSIRTTLGWYTHLTEDDIMGEALFLMKADASLPAFAEKGGE